MTDVDRRLLTNKAISRRTVLRLALGMGAVGLVPWLVACGGDAATATPPKPSAAPSAAAASVAPSAAASAPPAASTAPSAAAASAPAAAASAAPSTAASARPSAAASAAASTAAAGPVKRGGAIKVGLTSDVGNLDPLQSGFLVDREVFYNMYDSLVAIDRDLKIVPALAEKWELPDPKTYVFTLRKGVKFHDGTDFDAAAVKVNIERYLTDPKSRRKSEIDSIASVEVVDPSTVKFNLKAPFAPLLANLVDRAGMMLSPKAMQGVNVDDFTRKPLGAGTGAFQFVEWVTGDHVTLKRNPNYWKKAPDGQSFPYLDMITYRAIPDETVRLANLKTGDLDVDFNVPAKDYQTTKAGTDLVLQETSALSFSSVQFNTVAEPFNKKEFRQAFAYLIDRDQIAKTIFFDTLQAGYGPIPPSSWAYDASFKPYSVDVNKAKDLLKAGGKPDGFTFEMKIASGSPINTQLTQLIKDQVAKGGLIMNIVQEEATQVATDAQAGKFNADYYGWSGRIDPDGNIFNQMHGGGSLNDGKYANPQVDELLDKARASTDQNDRKSLYQQAQKLIVDDAPYVFYGFGRALLLTRPAIQGMQVWADQIMRFEAAWLK